MNPGYCIYPNYILMKYTLNPHHETITITIAHNLRSHGVAQESGAFTISVSPVFIDHHRS